MRFIHFLPNCRGGVYKIAFSSLGGSVMFAICIEKLCRAGEIIRRLKFWKSGWHRLSLELWSGHRMRESLP